MGYARNPRKLNHKGTKDTKEETQRQEEEDFLFSPAGWTPGKKASTPGGVRPIPEGIAIEAKRYGSRRLIALGELPRAYPALLLTFVYFVPLWFKSLTWVAGSVRFSSSMTNEEPGWHLAIPEWPGWHLAVRGAKLWDHNRVCLDTCVVLRLLMGAPAEQAQRAFLFVKDCYQKQIKVHVSDLVIQETYHALSCHYQVPVKEAVECLRDFLSSKMITSIGQALPVLQEYSGAGPGFADRLMRRDYLQGTVDTVLTFDKKFSQLSNIQKL
ncbi:MAG: hypothetical protein U5L00_02885 [Desulfovermiculus sp.]|nr:hypothetical protein [Desulfovermiculus sp.]